MTGRLEVQQWTEVGERAYDVALIESGQYIAVGTERGVLIFDTARRLLLEYPRGNTAIPVGWIAAHGTARISEQSLRLYVAGRQGRVVRLDLIPTEELGLRSLSIEKVHGLYEARDDIYSMAVAPQGDLIAIGHHSPALTVVDDHGQIVWQRHPDCGTATEGRTWVVTFDRAGDALYAASGGLGENRVASLDPSSGKPLAVIPLSDGERATSIISLAPRHAIAVVVADRYGGGRVLVYEDNVQKRRWVKDFEERVTAIAADSTSPIIACGLGFEGHVCILDGDTGSEIAPRLTLRDQVNGLALAQGRLLAAATNGHELVLLRYASGDIRI